MFVYVSSVTKKLEKHVLHNYKCIYVGTYFDNEITNKLSLESREITKGIVCVNISSSQGKKIVTEHMLNKHDR